MQSVKANGYITSEGYLVVDAILPIPPGKVEVIVRPLQTEAEAQQNTEVETSYTPEQEAVIAKFLKAAGAIRSGDPYNSVKVDEVVYGRK
jgi:hypothetical protein